MIPLKDLNPTRTTPVVTVSLIVVNCLVFGWQLIGGLEKSVLDYGAVPYYVTHLGSDRPAYYYAPVRYRTPFGIEEKLEPMEVPRPRFGPIGSLFTYMFLHGDFFHLLFNMLFLWIFGDNIEDAFGHAKFIIFYFVCGFGAAFIHSVFHPDTTIPMVGASGAISGIMGAYLLLFPRARVLTLIPIFFFIEMIELPALMFLGLWFLLQFLSLGSASNVAFLAHIAGFVLGMILARPFSSRRRSPPPEEARTT